jgi:hypothetical protein
VLLQVALWLAAASDYAGAEACRACHPAQYQAESSGAHARALARARKPQPGEWAFGAGEQAITFVRRLDPRHYLEEGKSWYRAIDGYARTPGHLNDAGVRDRIFDPAAAILRCFACHSTGPLRVTPEEGIVPRELGVRCEACHGPAAAHAGTPAKVRPRNPGRMSAAEINHLCGECHRKPAPQGTFDLADPWNARHQPLMLAASACFRKSNNLSCLTCHAAHRPVERRLSAYDPVCRNCHTTPGHKTDIATRACAGCHMPRVEPQPHLVFSNHRIAVYPDKVR